ncbi:hypothetical protein B0T26DRAFT_623466, partial [Lasiosphaeria miniovina]
VTARAYQTEMYEKSIKENIVVVMDTGSGKTLVATLRIMHELARIDSGKKIWFLTPTVELCRQQCKTLQQQIRSVEIRSFSSRDNVDGWRSQELWDAALDNVRVAVATYAVLQNSLSDGFVKMASIALIVFDEAHHCVGKSSGSKIMNQFFWRDKDAGRPVPHILGLTASPVNKVGGKKLKNLEDTLNATCKTPRLHRENLQTHVKRPTLTIEYYSLSPTSVSLASIASMRAILDGLDIATDPDIIRWRTENTERSREKLKQALKTNKTFVREQLRVFCERAEAMCGQLGTLAAEFYIAKVTSLVIESTSAPSGSCFLTWDYSSRIYLSHLLERVVVDPRALARVPSSASISAKMERLARILCSHHRGGDDGSRGIVFVTERATLAALHHLLSLHPDVSKLFRVGAVVGSSKHDRGRRDLGDIFNPDEQSKVLDQFRNGKLNLLVATSVLEEGIDVSACNLVICFDPPASPKSFIQRRGRARKSGSEYFVLIDEEERDKATDWEGIEEQLKAQYDRDDRDCAIGKQMADRETSDREFIEPTTGAILDMENAKGRLQRFCAVAGSRRYSDNQPFYVYEELANQPPPASDGEIPLMRAKVVLPASIPYSLRITWSKQAWRSEQNASKDAAFEAYMRLYDAKLVNENLLPLTHEELGVQDESSMIDIREQFNPWARTDNPRQDEPQTYVMLLEDSNGVAQFSFHVVAPVELGKPQPFQFYSAYGEQRRARFFPLHSDPSIEEQPRHVVAFRNSQGLKTLTQMNRCSSSTRLLVKACTSQLMYKLEAHLVTKELQTRLPVVDGSNSDVVDLIRSAITTPVRAEPEYQKLEFLGDACLKLLTTVHFATKYPLWPEGYLTAGRARVISNSRLCRAALERELDPFLLTKGHNAEEWQRVDPDNIDKTDTLIAEDPGSRRVARRTLAHAAKALIGAGKRAGGWGTALTWTKHLVGDVDLPSLEVGRRQLFDVSASDAALSAHLATVETLAGYVFHKKALAVQALTHSSYFAAEAHGCLDRLAFLGNAVVESIVSEAIFPLSAAASAGGASGPQTSCGSMTVHRAALVNRQYLGYVALEWHVSRTRTDVQQAGASPRGPFREKRYSVDFPLCRFLQHCSEGVADEMAALEMRYAELRDEIKEAVASGAAYPWLQLARLGASDFCADVVEALVGAVYVDSGSLAACEALLERMGVLPYLRRILRDGVDTVHPKEQLQAAAGGQAIRYEVKKRATAGSDKQDVSCVIYVGSRVVAEVDGGLSEDEVQIKAAAQAVLFLSS